MVEQETGAEHERQPTPEKAPQRSAVLQEKDVSIAMNDGVELAADIYRPHESGSSSRVPTILVRTTYDKSTPKPDIDPNRFAEHGFAVVIQDVRGRHNSGGDFYHGISEVTDGNDTLNWIAAQPWSNGRVGMTGISYLAAVQTAAACAGNEHLASLLHIFAPADYYRFGHRHGGCAALYMVPITFMFATTSKEANADPILLQSCQAAFGDSDQWLKRLPLKPGLNPLSRSPGIEKWLLDIMGHAEYGPFWSSVELWQPLEHLDRHADIPCLFVGGWYDMYREEQFYEALSPRKKTDTRLLIGPWTHLHFHAPETPLSGDVDFGEQANFGQEELFKLQLDWFEATLNPPARTEPTPQVRIFVMGGGSGHKTDAGKLHHGGAWRDETDWPLTRQQETPFYLHIGGVLSIREPEDEPPTRYLSDPTNPVPTIGGVHYFLKPDWQLSVPYGPQDQRERPDTAWSSGNLPLHTRHDLVRFRSEPLDAAIEVTGKPRVTLWVSSTARDTDIIVRLVDLYPPSGDYPDGYALNLSEGVLRMRYREGHRAALLLEADRIYRIEIELYPTSNLFSRGHRICLDVASSSFPAYDLNDQTGGPLLEPSAIPVRAQNSIFHHPQQPSCLILPVIPASE